MPSIIDDLKRAFSAGNIPSEKDFTTLIDLASRPNSLLGINEQGEAEAILNGLIVANNQLAISLAKDSGLNLVDNKLAVKAGAGININDTDGIFLKAESGSGIKIDKGIISVDPWPGVVLDDEKHLKANLGKGLKLVDNAVNLDLSDGLVVDDTSKKLAVKVLKDGAKDNTSGLVLGKDGLKINISPDGNNIEIDKTTGSLKLTQEALTTLKEGSRSKFISALQTAQEASAKLTPPALDEKDPVTLTIDAQGNQEEWQEPLERLINKAKSFGQNEVVRARDKLAGYLKDYISKAKNKPTNENIRLNFSASLDTDSLYFNTTKDDYFTLQALITFNSYTGDNIHHDDMYTKQNENGVNIENYPDGGYYAFAGKVSQAGREGVDSKTGEHITANAIMVYIDKNPTLRYVVGYWDLSVENPEWYELEPDPVLYDITRKVDELKISPTTLTMRVNDHSQKLNISGGDGSKKATFINEYKKYLKIDNNGTISPIAWNKKMTITGCQPASRTKNGTNSINLDIIINPMINIPFENQKCEYKYDKSITNVTFTLETKGGNPNTNTEIQALGDINSISYNFFKNKLNFKILKHGSVSFYGEQKSSDLYDHNSGGIFEILITKNFIEPVNIATYYLDLEDINEGSGVYLVFVYKKPANNKLLFNFERTRLDHPEKFPSEDYLSQKSVMSEDKIYYYIKATKIKEPSIEDYLGMYCFYNGDSLEDFDNPISNYQLVRPNIEKAPEAIPLWPH